MWDETSGRKDSHMNADAGRHLVWWAHKSRALDRWVISLDRTKGSLYHLKEIQPGSMGVTRTHPREMKERLVGRMY